MKQRIVIALVVCLVPIASAQVYKITDLGPLSPTAINIWGQVAGNLNGQAYTWSFGRMHTLGILTGGTFSSAAAINDLGVVTGAADGPGTLISPYPDLPNVVCSDLTQPFIWTPKAGMQGLGAPGNLPEIFFGGEAQACTGSFGGIYGRDINNSSQVVGDIPNGPNEYALALLWTRVNGMTSFGSTWPPTFGNGINNSGRIVGQNSGEATDDSAITVFIGHATSWQNGAATDLGTLGGGPDVAGYGSAANGVNESGQVVGWSTTEPVSFLGSPVHAVLWTANSISDLGTLPGDTSSAALKINPFGEVIGSSGNTLYFMSFGENFPFEVIGRPFVWSERSGMQDLNTLIRGGSGWVLNSVSDINLWGQIVGSGTRNGQSHGFLLTPREL